MPALIGSVYLEGSFCYVFHSSCPKTTAEFRCRWKTRHSLKLADPSQHSAPSLPSPEIWGHSDILLRYLFVVSHGQILASIIPCEYLSNICLQTDFNTLKITLRLWVTNQRDSVANLGTLVSPWIVVCDVWQLHYSGQRWNCRSHFFSVQIHYKRSRCKNVPVHHTHSNIAPNPYNLTHISIIYIY